MQQETSKARLGAGRKAGIVGIVCNILLFIIKITTGLLSGSMSIVADAINNLSDAGSSVFVLVGYVLSARPADKEHPYGHARAEYLCGLFISIIVCVLGIELLRSSAEQLFAGGSEAIFSPISTIVMSATVVIKGGMALYYYVVARRIDSQALRASAIDSIGDMCATGAVVAAMLLSKITGPMTDAVLGCVIAVYILILGIKLTKEASDTLLGKAPDKEFTAQIIRKIRKYEGVLGIHDLVIHSYGANRYFVSVHVEVDAEEDVMRSHDLIDNIEEDFRRELGIHMVIHMDPIQYKDAHVNEIRARVSSIIGEMSSQYSSPISMHDFRIVSGVTHSNLIFDVAVTDDFPVKDEALCAELQGEVKKIDPSYNAVITVDREYSSSRFGSKME
ncbi:MAG: cation transporter [Clostridiales bacterium]|nr:cation transporter [Clostridiales bacterium]